MKVVIHCNDIPWQREYFPRFQAGFEAHGLRVQKTSVDCFEFGAINVVFANNSWQNTVAQCTRLQYPLITVNRCFFGDRHDMVAIGWDGFNGDADFCLREKMPGDRWAKHGFELPPWQSEGGPVLVCGEFRYMEDWYHQVDDQLFGEAVFWRPHPFRADHHPVKRWIRAPGPLQDGISKSLAVVGTCVTFDSIAGCDAALAGVVSIAYGPRSMARPVSYVTWDAYVKGSMPLPDRTNWVNRLAYCQWSHNEIKEGAFWEHLKNGIDVGAGVRLRNG